MDAAEELSHQLWVLRELLEQLVFKLEVQSMLLGAGRVRWLPFIAAEVDAVIDAICQLEADRAAASERVARQVGLPVGTSLTELAGRLTEPWGSLLRQHRVHLLSLQGEVEESAQANHELARRGVLRTRELLAVLGEESVDLYTPTGTAAPLPLASRRLDRTV
ncbi:MAG: flagellar export chaperone FlgN [Acidimicrobiia bacterium]